ncbi:HAD hydrolase-like protein [Roseobacter sp. YSTF-M11]|uniref:HAD hydrolase-like protein n=1 Tax=Roseobacter insulae TaxID=2859783 RepID=A0A9X1JZB9_9RHOB|nr:HAD family hydrolase [Roseobacter insulae]MBW4709125.1 HAD hydrolase-like protein [Roseobacter insulae]
MSYLSTLTTDAAFARYEAVRGRLPETAFPARSDHLKSLAEVADRVDAFVLDAFGVLNVGQTPIPGAVERMAQLRAMGKKLVVLTNAASDTRAAALRKYHRLGFDFSADEVVASRDVCAARLDTHLTTGRWGAISTEIDTFADFDADVVRWTAQTQPQVDGFLILSSAAMDTATYTALRYALTDQARPLLVANPDIVAPRETGLSCEPGFFAHQLADEAGIAPHFFGKPFGNAFDDVKKKLSGIAPDRIAMVGDTLHTDILGARAAGLKSVLITSFGLFAGCDVTPYINRSGIVPDIICPIT